MSLSVRILPTSCSGKPDIGYRLRRLRPLCPNTQIENIFLCVHCELKQTSPLRFFGPAHNPIVLVSWQTCAVARKGFKPVYASSNCLHKSIQVFRNVTVSRCVAKPRAPKKDRFPPMQKGKEKERKSKVSEDRHQDESSRFLRRQPGKRKSSPNLLSNFDNASEKRVDKLSKSPTVPDKTKPIASPTKSASKSRKVRGRSQSSNSLTNNVKSEVHSQGFV